MVAGRRSKTVAFVAFLALTTFGGLATASAQPGDIIALNKAFQDHYARGNYSAAQIDAQELERLVKARFGADHTYYALALNKLGIVYWKQGKYSEAEGLHKRALAIRAPMIYRARRMPRLEIRPSGRTSRGYFSSARKGAGWSRTGPAHVPFPKSSIGGPAPIFWPNFLGKNFGNKNRVVSILEQRVLRVVPFCPIARDQRRRENLLDMWTQWHADSRQFDKSAKGEPPR